MVHSVDSVRLVRSKRRITLSFEVLEPFFCLADAFLITTTGIAGAISYQVATNDTAGDFGAYLGLGLVASVGYALVAWHMGLYRTSALLTGRWDGWSVVASWTLVALFLALVLFLLKIGNYVSRGSVICFIAFAGSALLVGRKFAKIQLARAVNAGRLTGRRVVLAGVAEELARTSSGDLLMRFGLSEIARVALLADHGDASSRSMSALDAALARARDDQAAEIVLALPWRDAALLEQVRDYLRVSPLPVRLLPDVAVCTIWNRQTASIGPPPIIDLQRSPLTRFERGIKRTFDIVVAAAALVALMPLIAVVALAIKRDSPGPVIFRQHRNGFNGRKFVIYKFRTMSVMENGPDIRQAERHDSRTTMVGRFLRRTSIDEIPQFLNVIKGDMSLVGPRPHAIAHDDAYQTLIGNYAFRRHVKPGITGWAQIHGLRGETSDISQMRRRVDHDIWYVSNWSPMLDMTIMVRTFFEVLSARNAF